MTWRFRKVFGAGPLRWILTKKGVGWSIGMPGFRYGISSNGKRYISVGFPGLGLYWIKYLDEPTKQHSQITSSIQPPGLSGSAPETPQATPEPTAKGPAWWKDKV